MIVRTWIAAFASVVPASALAQAPMLSQAIVVADSGDSAWVLAASVLILFAALPGFALLHGRGRVGPTGLALFIATAIVSLVFTAIGYTLAFGEGSSLLGGVGNVMLGQLANLRLETTIPEILFAFFHVVIAVFAIASLAGAIAERARLGWLTGFVGLWLLLVYVPVARALWGGGWLAQLGAFDFSGGIVLQTTVGTAALVIALLLRGGRATEVAQDSRLALAGVALIWIGWLGLVGGSALGGGDDAATAMLNAQLAASAAALTGLAIERQRTGVVSVYGASYAALAGLAAVSAGAGVVGPAGAMLLGALGALGAALAARAVRSLHLGNASSAFVAHGGGGIVGSLAFPLFIATSLGGPGFDATNSLSSQLLAQLVAVTAVMLWTAVVTAVAALMVSMVLPMQSHEQI